MKKIYMMALAVLIGFAAKAQADIALFHYNLKNGDTLTISPTIGRIIAWGFVNNGTTALSSTDKLHLKLSATGASYNLSLPATGFPVGDTLSFVDTLSFSNGPANGTIFNWCDSVWATNASGAVITDPAIANNKVCKSLYIKNNTSTSVSDLFVTHKKTSIATLDLFPSPAQDKFSFSYEFKGKPVTVSVYDMVGRKVFSQNISGKYAKENISIDVNSLTNGVYTVEVVEENIKSVGRLAVQH